MFVKKYKIYFVVFLLLQFNFSCAFFWKFSNNKNNNDDKLTTVNSNVDYYQKITMIKNLMHDYNNVDEASIFGVININNGDSNWISEGNIDLHTTYLRYGSINNMLLSYLLINKINVNKHIFYHGGFENYAGYHHGTDIIVKHLLTHTSGIPDYINFIDYEREIYNHNIYQNINIGWKNNKSNFIPGEFFCWSNSNYELVAWLLTNYGEKSLNNVIKQHFGNIAPSLTCDDDYNTLKKIIFLFPNTTFYNEWKYNSYTISHAGNLIGNPIDLVNAFKSILLDKQRILIMNKWNQQKKCVENKQWLMTDTYGLGLAHYENFGKVTGPFIGHDSNLDAKSIIIFHVPSNLIFFFHSTEIMDYDLFKFYLENLLEIWFNGTKWFSK